VSFISAIYLFDFVLGRISDAHSWPDSVGAAFFLPNAANFTAMYQCELYGQKFHKQRSFTDIVSFSLPTLETPPSGGQSSNPDISASWVVVEKDLFLEKAKRNLVKSLTILADGKDDILVNLAPFVVMLRNIVLSYLVTVNDLITISSTGVRGMKYSHHALLGHFIPSHIQKPTSESLTILEKYLSTQGYVVALNYEGEDLLVDLSSFRKS
jgi:hypothetical protein